MESNIPGWVKIGVYGIPSRRWIQFFMVASIILSIVLGVTISLDIILGNELKVKHIILLIIFPIAALHYYLTMKWIDKHQMWDRMKSTQNTAFIIIAWLILLYFVLRIAVYAIGYIAGYLSS